MNGSSDDLSPLREALQAARTTPDDLAEAVAVAHGRGPGIHEIPEPMPFPVPNRKARRLGRPVDHQILIWTRRGTIVAAVAAVIGLGTIALMIWPPH